MAELATDHLPWPLPRRPWLMWQHWLRVLFLHWPVEAAVLRPTVPPGLDLDTWDGHAWLSVVPFRMAGIRPRGLPALPWLSAFPELNLRTYVTHGGKPGVFFFSLDAANPVAVRVARRYFHLPYYDARFRLSEVDGWHRYAVTRTHRRAPPAQLDLRYRPRGPVRQATPGTIDHWLAERYCLYASRGERLWRGEIHHVPWPLQDADCEVAANTVAEGPGFELAARPALAHFAAGVAVRLWLPERLAP